MKLLTNHPSWQQWVRSEESRFTDLKHPAPTRYPCYAYMALDSRAQQTLRPLYLYQAELEAMALELMSTAQRM